MCDGIFSHKSFKSSIVEMSVIIADNGSRGSEARKNDLFQELDNNFVIICLARDGFNPFGYVIYSQQDVLVPK